MSDFLFDPAGRAPDALIGWRDGVPVLHDALVARARAWSALARRTPGTQVALFLDDRIEFAAALLGAWNAGKTVWLSGDTLPANCAALAACVDAFFGDFPSPHQGLVPGEHECDQSAWSTPGPDFNALVVYTSGSTGAAQAIPKQVSQLRSELLTLQLQFGGALGQAAVVTTVSHQHIYGLLFGVLWPLAAGRPMYAGREEYPEALAHALGKRPSVLVASPAHLKRLPAHLDWSAARAQLCAVFSSGGMLEPEAALNAAALLGQAPVEVYGSSETGGIAWRQRRDAGAAAWRALPGVEWRIGVGQALEVFSAHAGGVRWLQLADRAEPAGSDGFMLLGRSDRIVKIEEKRVSLDALEAALTGSGLAREARVIPGPAADGQRQSLAAFVVLTAAGRALFEEGGKLALNRRLRAALGATVEAVALPRRWRYLDQLPVNSQGKTTHAQLLALLASTDDPRPRFAQVQLREKEAQRVLLELAVPPDLVYFDGHFAVAPVLPGVVQVDWAIAYGREHFALDRAFRAIQALKFHQMIRPGSPVQLELVHDQAKGSVNFRYFSAAGPHSSGRILFGSE